MSFLTSIKTFISQKTTKKAISFPARKARGNYALALDIGTESVKCLVFSTRQDLQNKARILGVAHIQQEHGDMNGGAIVNTDKVAEKCNQAVEEAMIMANIEPEQMIVGIGGELVKGATTTIEYERPRPQEVINLNELKEIVHRVQWKAFDRVRKQLAADTGYPEIDVKLINAAITEVTVDGFQVANPLGFQGKYITISIFNAFAPLIHFSALKNIADQLDFDLLAITAEPYSIAKALNESHNNTWDGIIIDIGGGTTDIAVIRNGVLEGTQMFAMGGQGVTKRIEQLLNISFQEAEQIKLTLKDKPLPREQLTLLQQHLLYDAKIWRDGLILTLQEFSEEHHLPRNIYLCGGGSQLSQISLVLEEETWFKSLPFLEKPSIMQVGCNDIKSFVDETGKLKEYHDVTVLSLAHLALELAGEERLVDRILRKTLKMMRN
ncbi:MAG: pilus assembly protein PilM [Candidatus Abawacabacteria bacterium]|nr:pilus assembly protein PilM [Candidatus Abawacabacteria bacterium]